MVGLTSEIPSKNPLVNSTVSGVSKNDKLNLLPKVILQKLIDTGTFSSTKTVVKNSSLNQSVSTSTTKENYTHCDVLEFEDLVELMHKEKSFFPKSPFTKKKTNAKVFQNKTSTSIAKTLTVNFKPDLLPESTKLATPPESPNEDEKVLLLPVSSKCLEDKNVSTVEIPEKTVSILSKKPQRIKIDHKKVKPSRNTAMHYGNNELNIYLKTQRIKRQNLGISSVTKMNTPEKIHGNSLKYFRSLSQSDGKQVLARNRYCDLPKRKNLFSLSKNSFQNKSSTFKRIQKYRIFERQCKSDGDGESKDEYEDRMDRKILRKRKKKIVYNEMELSKKYRKKEREFPKRSLARINYNIRLLSKNNSIKNPEKKYHPKKRKKNKSLRKKHTKKDTTVRLLDSPLKKSNMLHFKVEKPQTVITNLKSPIKNILSQKDEIMEINSPLKKPNAFHFEVVKPKRVITNLKSPIKKISSRNKEIMETNCPLKKLNAFHFEVEKPKRVITNLKSPIKNISSKNKELIKNYSVTISNCEQTCTTSRESITLLPTQLNTPIKKDKKKESDNIINKRKRKRESSCNIPEKKQKTQLSIENANKVKEICSPVRVVIENAITLNEYKENNKKVDSKPSLKNDTKKKSEQNKPMLSRTRNKTIKELTSALKYAEINNEIKAVLLSSVGPIFCSGLNPFVLQHIMEYPEEEEMLNDLLSCLRGLMHTMVEFKKPIIAAVQGPAIGLGASLLMHCDVIYASERAVLQWPYLKQGLPPDGCVSYLLPAVLGENTANALLMYSQVLPSESARVRGIFNEVYQHDSLSRHVYSHMSNLVQAERQDLIAMKSLLKSGKRKKKVLHSLERECSKLKIITSSSKRIKRSLDQYIKQQLCNEFE